MREAHGTLGLRRLIQNLPLLLQIILVLLLTAVLARPALTTAVSDSKDIVLVLDVSASMQTDPITEATLDQSHVEGLSCRTRGWSS